MQDLIEMRLSAVFRRSITIAGSGRTDAGVHATGQVFHTDLPPVLPGSWVTTKAKQKRRAKWAAQREAGQQPTPAQTVGGNSDLPTAVSGAGENGGSILPAPPAVDAAAMFRLLSRGLPPTLTVLEVEPVAPDFHARNSCVGKR